MTLLCPLLALLAALAASPAAAGEAAVVEGLLAPAWVERAGARAPLMPGMYLESGDRLSTGPGARALLRLSEGSHLRLGGETALHLASLEPPAEAGGPFTGRLELHAGALRFSTSALSGLHRRTLELRLGELSARLGGTDLWAGAGPDGARLCLIEGRVEVTHRGQRFAMGEPLTVYPAGAGGADARIAPVDPARLALWTEATELAGGTGVLRAGGPWRVTLKSFLTREQAVTALRELHRAGYGAQIREAEARGRTRHRVVMEGFASHAEARAFAAALAGRFRIREPWVSAMEPRAAAAPARP